MRITLSSDGNRYINRRSRGRFAPWMQWLGLVVADGVEGALAFNADTCKYIRFLSEDQGLILNTERVLEALEVATRAKPGRPPMQTGRPVRNYAITMPDADADYARKLGDGNLSAGIRLCIKLCSGLG